MKQKIVVSNVRFPYYQWQQVKSVAAGMGMSTNEYFQYLANTDAIHQITGVKKTKNKTSRAKAYQAFADFASRQVKGKPMRANEDDKIIYGIE